MKVFAKGAPRGTPASASSVDKQQQQQDKNETVAKKSSASGPASSSKEAASSAAKKKKKMKSRTNANSSAEEEDDNRRPEQREDQPSKDQSSKDQSSKRADDGQEEKEKKKKKKKKERIPLINRVPTALEYDSDDSLERMIRQRSRYSRYMTEYDVNADNFVDDAGDDDDGGQQDDKYNAGIARLWSNSTDSDPPQWRSWDNDETDPTAAAPNKDTSNKLLEANDEDEISAMFHSKPTSGRFIDELKKVVSGESNRRSSSRQVVGSKNEEALNLNNTDLPLFSKVSKEKRLLIGEHIENTEGGQVETILDPLNASSGLADDDDDDDDIVQIIRPSSSDTSSLTDPIKREEMLIAARIRASANENENIKQPDVPRVLSLTKKRSHATQPSQSAVPALTMLNSTDSTNEPRTGVSKGTTAGASSPPATELHANGPTTAENAEAPKTAAVPPGEERDGGGGQAADVPEKSDSLKEDSAAAKNAALEKGDKIQKDDTVLTSTSSSSSKSSKAPNNKQNRPVRSAAATNPKATAKPTTASGTNATEVSDVAPPKTGDADAAIDEPKKSSRQSFFSMVPLFRSLSGLRGGSKSKSRDGKSSTPKSRAGTPTPERVESVPDNEKSGQAEKIVQKPVSRRTRDKYTPTLEKVRIVSNEAPIPEPAPTLEKVGIVSNEAPIPEGGGDEKVISSSDAKVSPDYDGKVTSSSDDKKDNESKTTSENDGEMKESPPRDNKAIAASNDNPDDSEQPPPPQENSGPQDVNTLLAVTELDKQEPAWCDIGKRGLTPAERNLMYSKSLANDSGSQSTLDRVTGGKKANMVYKARKAKKAQMKELDEYSYAISVVEEPDVVQCLKFYYCGAVAHVFGVAIAATDCNNPKKQIKASEVRTGVLSTVEEVDEVEAQRWRDDNTLSPKVEVMLDELQEKPRPVDHVDIDLDKGKRQQFQRRKKASIGEVPKAEKCDEENVRREQKHDEENVRREQKHDEEEGSDGGTADFEIERQISRVKEVTKMHFSLDEDSEENRRHEAMLWARRMAGQSQREEIPITSIQIPTKSMETSEETDPTNPPVEERRGEDDKNDIGGENGDDDDDDDDTLPKPVNSGLETDSEEKEDDMVKKVYDDETMETSTGSSQESAGSGSKQTSAPPQKKKLLSRFLPHFRRKAIK